MVFILIMSFVFLCFYGVAEIVIRQNEYSVLRGIIALTVGLSLFYLGLLFAR